MSKKPMVSESRKKGFHNMLCRFKLQGINVSFSSFCSDINKDRSNVRKAILAGTGFRGEKSKATRKIVIYASKNSKNRLQVIQELKQTSSTADVLSNLGLKV